MQTWHPPDVACRIKPVSMPLVSGWDLLPRIILLQGTPAHSWRACLSLWVKPALPAPTPPLFSSLSLCDLITVFGGGHLALNGFGIHGPQPRATAGYSADVQMIRPTAPKQMGAAEGFKNPPC